MKSSLKNVLAAILIPGLLAACDNSKTASNSNFKTVLQTYYDKTPECTALNDAVFPADLGPGDPSQDKAALDVLVKAGLLTSTTSQRQQPNPFGPPDKVTITHYILTPTGAKFIRAAPPPWGGTEICYANRQINKIELFTAPASQFGYQISDVTYDYTLKNVPDWATNPALQSAFPNIATALKASPPQQSETLVLTSDGWKDEHDVPGLD